jgi:hypothetical protein
MPFVMVALLGTAVGREYVPRKLQQPVALQQALVAYAEVL